jgi:amino acid permease
MLNTHHSENHKVETDIEKVENGEPSILSVDQKEDEDTVVTETKRSLDARHLQMIAIGTSIG